MGTSAPPRPFVPASPTDPLQALIEEARRRQRRRRLGIALLLVAAVTASAVYFGAIRNGGADKNSSSTRSQRLCVSNLSGWQSRVVHHPGSPPALLLTNFRFGRADYLYGHTDFKLRWPRGGILVSIANWTSAATKAMEPQYRPTSILHLRASDFSSFEGVPILGQEHALMNGQLLEVWVQARPTTASTIASANSELANVRVCG